MLLYGYSVGAAALAQGSRIRRTLAVAALALAAAVPAIAGERRPADIVDARTVIPDLAVDMRYLTARNFVGRPIAGYRAPVCLLTKRAAAALKRVEDELKPRGLGPAP